LILSEINAFDFWQKKEYYRFKLKRASLMQKLVNLIKSEIGPDISMIMCGMNMRPIFGRGGRSM